MCGSDDSKRLLEGVEGEVVWAGVEGKGDSGICVIGPPTNVGRTGWAWVVWSEYSLDERENIVKYA